MQRGQSKTKAGYDVVPDHIPRKGSAHPEKTHRVIGDISLLPSPEAIYKVLMSSEAWPYQKEYQYLKDRDLAFVATLYATGLRVTEARRLKVTQLVETSDEKGWMFRNVELVKVQTTRSRFVKVKGRSYKLVKSPRQRVHTHRPEIFLPNTGPRVHFTQLILKWARKVKGRYLFSRHDSDEPMSRVRGWQIVNHLTGQWPHFFRVAAENILYRAMDNDMKGVADYFKVDERTLARYLKSEKNVPRV